MSWLGAKTAPGMEEVLASEGDGTAERAEV
jgi:hypothetical protein